jgi:hypothetical protein
LLGYAEDDAKNVAYQQKLKKMGLTFWTLFANKDWDDRNIFCLS